MELVNSIVNNVVYLSLLFLVGTVIVGIYVRIRSRDRCLLSFDGCQATVETEGKTVWGTVRVYSTGIELEYDKPHRDADGHTESSYIVYASEYDSMDALFRFHDRLSEDNQKRRTNDIRKTYRPGLLRKTRRNVRNFFAIFRDALLQSFQSIIGATAKTGTAAKILSRQKEISGLGKQLISAQAQTAYDPILEHHIGRFVVVDATRSGEPIEYHGILKEYTAMFIEILNVEMPSSTDTQQGTFADVIVPRVLGCVRHAGCPGKATIGDLVAQKANIGT